ncbi:hypothetical protein Tco_1222373, partial [Tanacetum coccineum]
SFKDCVSPAVSAALDPDHEPLGSPDTTDYYRGYEFLRNTPHKTTLLILRLFHHHHHLYYHHYHHPPIQSPARSGPSYRRSRSSSPSNSPHSLSPHHKRYRVSPTPALPIAGELAVIASALPSVPIELLPPHKRFTTIERIETLEIEVKSLTARLTEAEI